MILVIFWGCLAHDSMGKASDDSFQTTHISDRKEPSIFRRPAMENASEQLKHADELLAQGQDKKALKQYRALVHQWPNAPESSKAELAYAKLLMKRGKYAKAFDEFQYLIDNYAGQFDYEEVIDSQFRVANIVMTQKHFTLFVFPGFSSPERALLLFERVVKNAPDWAKAPEAAFYIGLINEQTGALEDAVRAYGVVQSRYSSSDYAAGASFRNGYCLYKMYKRTPRDEVLCRRALTALAGFVRDYAGDPNEINAKKYIEELKDKLTNMRYDIAVFYDYKAHNPRAAIIAYSDFVKSFPSSALAVKANRRIVDLQEKMHNSSNGEESDVDVDPSVDQEIPDRALME